MRKLPNAPLKEAIFEVRWPLQPDESGRQLVDKDYTFAVGKFQGELMNDFPYHVARFPREIPDYVFNHQVMHQFRKEENSWPVVQIGPGIATVNDTEQSYEWERTYLPNIKRTLHALKQGYGELVFSQLSLRYIDMVRVLDYGLDTWEEFVNKHINFDFRNHFNTRGKLASFNFEQAFDLNDTGLLHVGFSNGQNNKKESVFIWQTAVIKRGRIHQDLVPYWLEEAHSCTSELFREICKDDFYATFN